MLTKSKTPWGLSAVAGLLMAANGQAVSADCSFNITNEWSTGYTAEVSINNESSSAIDGWSVSWDFNTNSLTNGWNAQFSGTTSVSASDLGWNANVAPGESVAFGFQVAKNGAGAETPQVSGNACNDDTDSGNDETGNEDDQGGNDQPDSGGGTDDDTSSAQQCNWFGTLYPLCEETQTGWGWENNQSCISVATCSDQPEPYGIVDPGDDGSGDDGSGDDGSGDDGSNDDDSGDGGSSDDGSSDDGSGDDGSSDDGSGDNGSGDDGSSDDGSGDDGSGDNGSGDNDSGDGSGRVDNPFADAQLYVNPVWANKAMGEPGGEAIAGFNTAVWMDRRAAITDGIGLKGHLDEAVNQGADTFMFVVYNLPNRDCAALASNGELLIAENGFQIYQEEFIAPIVEILGQPQYADLRIVAVIEVDSLPNLVTNLNIEKCQEANGPGGYVDGIQHALNELGKLDNVYSYVDVAHSGWLGWSDNFTEAVQLIGDAIKGTEKGVDSIAGFVTNSANYTPLSEPFLPDPSLQVGGQPVRSATFYEWNPMFGELEFAQEWREAMIDQGFPSSIGMLIDTGRNGWGGPERPTEQSDSSDLDTFVNESKIDRRAHRGNWCNQPGGVGERPQANPEPGIDAYVWVKPQGESDGVSTPDFEPDPNDPNKKHDGMCDPNALSTAPEDGRELSTGALPNAPHAGRWFPEAFEILLDNAYPPLD